MPLIGMFHYRENPEKVTRAYSYAAVAKMEDLDFFFFSSKRVDLERKVIMGLKYEAGKWVEKEYPYPEVIINVVGPITKKQQEIYQTLKKAIPFTSFPVGTKLSVYNRIKRGEEYTNYLLPYIKIKKPIDALKFLNDNHQIIIKPISGNHGNQIVYIEVVNDLFIVKENETTNEMNRIELFDFISKRLENCKLLAQRYVNCKRKTGEPYDIRLHIQKDKDGKWANTIVYPKIGFKDKITTNLGQGGQILILDNFLFKEFGEDYFNIKRYLEIFALQFGSHFDTLYKQNFDELGIDVGIDENKKIWIYEVNWRPGHLYIESLAAYHAVMYAKYIAEERGKGELSEEVNA